MTTKLNERQLVSFREAFALFDKDGDGKISTSELSLVMKSFYNNSGEITNDIIQDIINDVDANGDGTIDFDEFLYFLTRNTNEQEKEDELYEVFRIFDQDGNGLVSPSELKLGMMNIGERMTDQEVSDLIREADLDGDGHINFKEFCKIMSK